MKILLVMPLSVYNLWLSRSAIADTAYGWLKNGFIVRRNENGTEEVQILCDHERLANLMDYAKRVCPEAVPYITSNLTAEM